MSGTNRWMRVALVLGLYLPLAVPAWALDRETSTPLQFRITEGRVENAFYQDGPIAAHLLLSSGERPRVLVAFPAGNSGVGVWFEDEAAGVQWTLQRVDPMKTLPGPQWHGIEASTQISASRLRITDAVLGSVRVLRDYQLGQGYPQETRAQPQIEGRTIRWQRDRLDGAPGYLIALTIENGKPKQTDTGIEVIADRKGQPLRLRIEAATGETPLTPFASDLLNDKAGADVRSRQALQFLSYEEKFLAGSWRFDTYFGRDTLMSLRLLMPALQPRAVDAGIASVLARLSDGGEVAHEEDIGEFAVLRHRKQGEPESAQPIFDYAMIDDDYMLPPVAAAWLLDDPRGRENASKFLAESGPNGKHGDALVRNLLFVAASSEAFAKDPRANHLIALKEGRSAGQWRDSNEGIGRGHYPYDVNVVWMPASLRAISAFLESGLLDPYLQSVQRNRLRKAVAGGEIWERKAGALFTVRMPAMQAATQVRAYAVEVGVDEAPAIDVLAGGDMQFPAIALDAQGQPIPILHSDEGFRLLFGRADPRTLERDVTTMMRPFPAGLMTDAGLLVANPAYADHEVWPRFGNNAYHGTVIWAWQQAVMAAGLQRQIARSDLPSETRALLREAETKLWTAIRAADAVRTSELWSWSYRDGRYQVEPFGAQGAHEDESNAAQLWSTVFLALKPPAGVKAATEAKQEPQAVTP